MAPPESAPAPTLPQLCAKAFRIFEARNREQHPRSAMRLLLMDEYRIAADCLGCDCELIFGALRLDPGTNSVMVHHRERESGVPVVSTLDTFAGA